MAATWAQNPKNVILFIGDGMSTPQRMTADEFSRKAGKGTLAMNNLNRQATTRTCSANRLITDSAAAATAIACGEKTNNGIVGMNAKLERLESVAEFAKKTGRKIGIVTSVTINHATPAGFYGHQKNRGMGYQLGLDLLASGFDYFAGGGLSRHNDTNAPSYRGDIYALAAGAGYRFINRDRAAFAKLERGVGKVWYVASDGALPYAIDTKPEMNLPTLAELTQKGLDLLSDSSDGFFMMVEGGRIDWAGHGNDPATNLRELMALDDAVKVALEFQKAHPDTLIVVTGDHETGGMAMGFAGTGDFHMDRLVGQCCSGDAISSYFNTHKITEFEAAKPFIKDNFKFAFTDDEWKSMEASFNADVESTKKGIKENAAYDAVKVRQLPAKIKAIVSHKCGIGWSSGSHTALPVLTTLQGPGEDEFKGLLDNTDIAKTLKRLLK